MSPAVRSVLVVNRSSLIGTALVLILSTVLLTSTGAWLAAGLADEQLLDLATVASSFAGTVMIITVFVVATVFSGALRERRREFALLRAVGATAAQVRATISAEALVLLLIALPIGAAIGLLVAPLLTPLLVSGGVVPAGFTLPFSPLALLAVLIVLPTGLVAARAAARGILRVSPTEAVRDSAADPTTISRGRRLTAAGLGITGLLSALTPFFAPGTIGAATASVSAIALIVAAALGGPALVHWAALRSAALLGTTSGTGRMLALINARGFSHRLSAAVVPLALLVALGSVQSGANSTVSKAGAQQLGDGLHADSIASSSVGITPEQAGRIAALPGVTATTATGHLTAAVRTAQPDDGPSALDRLDWESTALRTFSPGTPLFDPAVRSGSLQSLEQAGTIAVSRDAILTTGKHVGDTVEVRVQGHAVITPMIVAVYDRGLGFGDYLIGAAEAGALASTSTFDAVLVQDGPGSRAAIEQVITGMGLTVSDNAGYARIATQQAGAQQRLSLVLLLALLGFLGVAAANTLATWMRSRRAEFSLLMRIGATRRQVLGMVTVETGFVALTAVAIGLLAVLPALVGAGQGLLGVPLPQLDLQLVGALVGATVLIAAVTAIPTAWRATSTAAARRS